MKKFIIIAYVAALIAMGTATFVEKAEGTSFAHQNIYGAWWFTLLWAVLAILGMVAVVKHFTIAKNFKIFMLHVSFFIILVGALLTHLTARSGTIHLRINHPQDVVEIVHNGRNYFHRLPFAIQLKAFSVVEDTKGNAIDYKTEFTIAERSYLVSMNNIARYGNMRFYQASYDSDKLGSTLIINRDPYGIPVTYCGYALLFVSFIALCLKKVQSLKIWLPTILLTALWCIYYFLLDGSWAQIPVLRHPLLIFHVVIIILAYALLLIQTAISAWALLRHNNSIVSVMHPALCLLSIGIFLGAIWANISWGNYWSWDSKETWALITLMIYAIPLHQRSLPIFRQPKAFHVFMLCAFLTVLMTYFGVNYFLAGMHSYA